MATTPVLFDLILEMEVTGPPPVTSPVLKDLVLEMEVTGPPPVTTPVLKDLVLEMEVFPESAVVDPCAGWGEDVWAGQVIHSPSVTSLLLLSDPIVEQPIGPPTCRKAERFDLCDWFPQVVCDQDPHGDHHRILGIFEDALFGSINQTGLLDDVASLLCLLDPAETPEDFLNLLLLHLGWNLKIGLSTLQKRKILPILVDLYRIKGTDPGIVEALSRFLGIPVEILLLSDPNIFGRLEAGEPFSLSLTSIVSGSDFVSVDHPERFDIGTTLFVTDTSAPYVDFSDSEILDIVANRIYFTPQTLGGTIEIGAQVSCNRFRSRVAFDPMGVDMTAGANDPGAWAFYVDVQRTVATTTDLEDGDTSLDLDESDFIIVGSRVRVTDGITTIILKVLTKTGLTITFDQVSLDATIPSGSEAINLFNAEEVAAIDEIVKWAKVSYTHHAITRDRGEDLVTIG